MNSTEKKESLLAAITDIQGILRALDNKVIAVFVILLLPFSQLQVLIEVFKQIIEELPVFGKIILCLFIVSWLLSFIFIFVSLLGRQVKEKDILNDTNAKGIFYNDNSLKLSDHQNEFNNADLLNELSFEHLKLIAIKQKKMFSHKVALISSVSSFIFLLMAWLPVVIKNNL